MTTNKSNKDTEDININTTQINFDLEGGVDFGSDKLNNYYKSLDRKIQGKIKEEMSRESAIKLLEIMSNPLIQTVYDSLTAKEQIQLNKMNIVAIKAIAKEWEEISAFQAKKYLQDAIGFFGNDDAKYLHALSEAYAFSWNLRYAPVETRRFTPTSHTSLMNLYKSNFWEMTVADLNAIIAELDAKY